jgi:hypothetical protein
MLFFKVQVSAGAKVASAKVQTVTGNKHEVRIAHAKRVSDNGKGRVVASGRDEASVGGGSASTAITIAKGQTNEAHDDDFEEF